MDLVALLLLLILLRVVVVVVAVDAGTTKASATATALTITHDRTTSEIFMVVDMGAVWMYSTVLILCVCVVGVGNDKTV